MSEKQEIKYFEDLKNNLPTFYDSFIYSEFMETLKRPSTVIERKEENKMEPFKVKILSINDFNRGKKEKFEYVELSKNILPDFRTSLFGLHYMDKFATCDKNQAILLNCLFPQYKNKVFIV